MKFCVLPVAVQHLRARCSDKVAFRCAYELLLRFAVSQQPCRALTQERSTGSSVCLTAKTSACFDGTTQHLADMRQLDLCMEL